MAIISPEAFSKNVFELIGKRWALIGAYDKNKEPVKYNAMTASWGGMGVLWGKNVFWCFIRPQRYTKEFIENSNYITLSFFDEKYREALNICGRVSGRDYDKLTKANLTPVVSNDGVLSFEESDITIVGKKLYKGKISPEGFIDNKFIDTFYPQRDFHDVYVCEIVKIQTK